MLLEKKTVITVLNFLFSQLLSLVGDKKINCLTVHYNRAFTFSIVKKQKPIPTIHSRMCK